MRKEVENLEGLINADEPLGPQLNDLKNEKLKELEEELAMVIEGRRDEGSWEFS
jgi:hypothetical protein